MLAEDTNYCPRCGNRLTKQIRMGGERSVCIDCDWIFFPDPKVAAALLVWQNGEILMVRRANNPRRGFWTLPVGFVNAGEHPARTAERECFEETGLTVKAIELLDVYSGQEHPRGSHILIVYLGEIVSGELKAGDDVDQVKFYPPDSLPNLAFKTTKVIIGSFMDKTHGKLNG